MAAFLALAAAVFFALAATLQQRGQCALARRGSAVEGVAGLVRLLAVPVWLAGTVVLLLGYGYWLTAQNVVRRQVLGAGVVVIALALFVLVGNPDAGAANASTESMLLAVLVVSAVAAVLLLSTRAKPSAAVRAAVLGVCAGLDFGLLGGLREAGPDRPPRQRR